MGEMVFLSIFFLPTQLSMLWCVDAPTTLPEQRCAGRASKQSEGDLVCEINVCLGSFVC